MGLVAGIAAGVALTLAAFWHLLKWLYKRFVEWVTHQG